MSFWDVVWTFFWVYVWISYLMVLFSIFADIFRDHTLGGVAKALWILFLLFIPFLAALIYLIARGRGMTERSVKVAQTARSESDAYIRSVASSSPADDIAKGKALLDAGTITAAEFDALKAHALNSTAK